jgi:phage gpG-like protein
VAGFEIKITDNSGEVLKAFQNQLQIALEAVGTQAESHAKQVISDSLVYGHTDLTKYGERDNSRVAEINGGTMRNRIAHTVVKHDVYIGTNVPYAVYHELGTGIYASQPGGRQTPWVYFDRKGKAHKTRGLYPIHFLKKAASEHTEEYKKIIEKIMKGE